MPAPRPFAAVPVLLMVLALAAPALADDPPPVPQAPGAPKADEPAAGRAGVIKLDIVESIDGKESKLNVAVYFLKKKLGEAGYRVFSTREPAAPKSDKPEKPEDAPKPATPAAPPVPDLVIVGKVDCKLLRTSDFYEKAVAYIYETTAELTIADGSGKTLATVKERDEWGRSTKKAARDESLKRLANWITAAVLKEPAIQARLDDAGKQAAEAYVKKVEAARKTKPEESDGGGGGGEGGASPGTGE